MEIDRRTWMRLAPALAMLSAVEEEIGAQQPRAEEPPQRVSAAMLHEALALIGLEFTKEHEAMMLSSVNRNLRSYDLLRGVRIPLDTEPAIRFSPLLPGRKPPAGPARFQLSRQTAAAGKRQWKSLDELAFLPVTELAPLVRSRRVSSTELTRMYLDRLKRWAPKLNCVITFTEDLAMKQAERADREIRSGKYRGPLHGIPWGAKDLFAVKGYPTTWGAEPYRNQAFDYDAAVVERLEQAGAVLIAKLSMGALAQGGLWFGGMTKTPWNLERTSSGSSAGSASATAAGLTGFSLGTETLGSIISPSVACGAAGLRPTFGRVSRYGAMALSWTMDKVGPICRSVEDCALVLNAIHGADGRDLAAIDAPFSWAPDAPLAGLRVGYVKDEFSQASKDSVYAKALDALAKIGIKPEPVKLPDLPAGAIRIVLVAEAAAQFDDLTRDGGVNQLSGQQPFDWPNTFRASRLIPAVEYVRAQRARTLLMRQMDELMSKWDVIISPPGASLTVTNLTGHPQITVPCGFTDDRPQGLLFTGRLYEEGTPMRLARAFEQATEWRDMHPKIT